MSTSEHNVHGVASGASLNFTIDPKYKTITPVFNAPNDRDKPIYYPVQYNHCADRYTFQIPPTIEGHDMTKCNDIQIHFVNIKADVEVVGDEVKVTNIDETSKVSGVYSVDDKVILTKVSVTKPLPGTSNGGSSEETVTGVSFSWTVSDNATQYSGILAFAIHFKCTNGETVDYSWNTRYYSNLYVLKGINNTDAVVSKYTDILQQWHAKLFEMTGGAIDHNSGEALSFWIGTHAEYDALPEEEKTIPNCLYVFEDDPTISTIAETLNTHTYEIEQLKTSVGEGTTGGVTKDYVDTAISNAIGNAIGGSY